MIGEKKNSEKKGKRNKNKRKIPPLWLHSSLSFSLEMKYDVTVPVGIGEYTTTNITSSSNAQKKKGRFDAVLERESSSEEDEAEEDLGKNSSKLMIGNVTIDNVRDINEGKKKKKNEVYWKCDDSDDDDLDDDCMDDDEEDIESYSSTSSSSSSDNMEEEQLSDSAEYERQLKAIAGMALDGGYGGGYLVPSPGSSFGESSSSGEEDDWTSKKGRQKALAKKRRAKRAAQEQLMEEEELETYVESVLETLMYLGDGSYIGLPAGMTKLKLECVRDIVNQRSGGSASGFVFETLGGGKRIHAVIRFQGNSSGANRSVSTHYGKEIKDKNRNKRNRQQRGSNGTRKNATPVSFIKAGEATDLTKVESEDDDDNDDDIDDNDGERKVYANRGLRRAAEAEAKAKALRRARKKASKGVPIDAGRNYAEFEQHSNAIGSKLMKKMGFTHGTGLGAKRDGKAEPVEAVMRKKRAGLGT